MRIMKIWNKKTRNLDQLRPHEVENWLGKLIKIVKTNKGKKCNILVVYLMLKEKSLSLHINMFFLFFFFYLIFCDTAMLVHIAYSVYFLYIIFLKIILQIVLN